MGVAEYRMKAPIYHYIRCYKCTDEEDVIFAELVNAVQNRPNAVYAKACFSLRVRVGI